MPSWESLLNWIVLYIKSYFSYLFFIVKIFTKSIFYVYQYNYCQISEIMLATDFLIQMLERIA